MNTSAASLETAWLTSDNRVVRLGYIFVAAFLGVGGLWAGCAPIDSAAIAPGVVRVQGYHRAVQHLEGGLVAEMFVRNGDVVTHHQPLIQLDTTKSRSELKILEGRVFNLEARLDRLVAERDGLTAPIFSDRLHKASQSDQRAVNAVIGEQTIFDARAAAIKGELAVAEQRVAQLEKQMAGLIAMRDSEAIIQKSLAEEIFDLRTLLAEGYVDKQRVRELERSNSRSVSTLADLDRQIASGWVGIEEARLNVAQINKRFKTDVVDELNQVEERLYDVEQQHTTVADMVERSTIRAPSSGTVLGMDVKTIGAVVGPGQELMRIIPKTDSLMIDAQVSPMDIDRVKIGQVAEIRFSVFKDAYLVTGTLVNLSADSLANDKTGQTYYQAEVEIIPEDMTLLGEVQLIPGMPAEVLIKTGERTLLAYITSPIKRLFASSLTED